MNKIQNNEISTNIKNQNIDSFSNFHIEEEEKLSMSILNKDIENAEKALFRIFDRLFNISKSSHLDMKFRLQEIITIMSRATLKAGATDSEVWSICEKYYKKLFIIKKTENLSYDMSIILYEFFDLINTNNSITYSKPIMRAIKFANSNYNQAISLISAADQAHLSVSYFCKSFQKETGFTWTKYLNKIRIKQSKKLLKTTEKSILEIAESTGFETQCYFSRTFKKLEGITPSKFRKTQSTNFITK